MPALVAAAGLFELKQAVFSKAFLGTAVFPKAFLGTAVFSKVSLGTSAFAAGGLCFAGEALRGLAGAAPFPTEAKKVVAGVGLLAVGAPFAKATGLLADAATFAAGGLEAAPGACRHDVWQNKYLQNSARVTRSVATLRQSG